ncbi:TPA: ferredoxin [archaeon]|nr:ferredoxin [Candidatus Naiadarchaeales archaeon SRR2090159.bin1288]
MTNLRIEFDRSKCIGAGQCRLSDPIDFVYASDGTDKTDLADSANIEDPNIYVKEGDHPQPHMPVNAGIHCPVKAIRVVNLETGEVKAPR